VGDVGALVTPSTRNEAARHYRRASEAMLAGQPGVAIGHAARAAECIPAALGGLAVAESMVTATRALLADGPISAFEVAMVLGCSEADARAAMQRARGES
jgi:hypothetical protein